MSSLPSMLFTLLLFSEICAHSMALPLAGAGNYDDDRTDLESLDALLEDNKLPAGAGVQNLGGFTNRLDEGRPRIIIVSDTGFRGHRTHGLDRASSRALLAGPNADHTPGDLRVNVDRRETDLDMLRCMIGRVYRPCWQA
ncbi:pro-MCH [Gadus macrocephalus]|uniref:pro-MCH n=1 Tax=Gadus macrocephalus TaxID=80720 RepID=UPI0028CB414C|nr:pro-MCH [Gadus macrocephalus]